MFSRGLLAVISFWRLSPDLRQGVRSASAASTGHQKSAPADAPPRYAGSLLRSTAGSAGIAAEAQLGPHSTPQVARWFRQRRKTSLAQTAWTGNDLGCRGVHGAKPSAAGANQATIAPPTRPASAGCSPGAGVRRGFRTGLQHTNCLNSRLPGRLEVLRQAPAEPGISAT